jgi:hypothetical protein
MQTHVFSRFIHHICFVFLLIIVSRHKELSMRGAIRPAPRFCSSLLSPELDTDTKILLLLCFFVSFFFFFFFFFFFARYLP